MNKGMLDNENQHSKLTQVLYMVYYFLFKNWSLGYYSSSLLYEGLTALKVNHEIFTVCLGTDSADKIIYNNLIEKYLSKNLDLHLKILEDLLQTQGCGLYSQSDCYDQFKHLIPKKAWKNHN